MTQPLVEERADLREELGAIEQRWIVVMGGRDIGKALRLDGGLVHPAAELRRKISSRSPTTTSTGAWTSSASRRATGHRSRTSGSSTGRYGW